jgi:ketosteroid isomerase-like protein
MKKPTRGAVLAVAAAGLIAIVIGTRARAAAPHAEAEVRVKEAEANLIKAVNARNVDAIMARYSAKADLVVFDLIPPLQYAGPQAWRKNWEGFLNSLKGTLKVEQSDLKVEGSRRIAFAHSIWHWKMTDPSGKSTEITMRATDCFENQGGKWLIVHAQYSVPSDLETGKSVLNAKL